MSYHPTQSVKRAQVPSLQKADADIWETTLGQPDEQQVKTWGWEAARFISSQIGYGKGQWRGVRPLGKGSFGIVGLWEKVNDNGEVVDRVVIKEENYRWAPRIPAEVETMKLLGDTGCESVVKLRGYKRYGFEGRRRTYMEFCPHGDLVDLITRYKTHKRYLPEPFLWHAFQSLAEAAYAMEYGPFLDDNGQPLDFEVVHRDIKPANIFLGDENRHSSQGEQTFPYYPTPKLGDFGLAIKTNRYDKKNPRRYDGAGTRAYRAPEQSRNSDRFWNPVFRHADNKILAWTNVYAIGLVMYELCTLRRFTKTHSGRPDYEGDGLEPISTRKKEEYSHELRELIRECLRPATDMRPGTKKLISLTRLYASNWHDSYDLRKYPVHPIPEERLYYQGSDIEELELGEGGEGGSKRKLDSRGHSDAGESRGGFHTISESSDEKRGGGGLPETPIEPEIDHEFFYRYEAAAIEFMEAEKRRKDIEEAKLKGGEAIEDDSSHDVDSMDEYVYEGVFDDEDEIPSPGRDMGMQDVIYADEWAERCGDGVRDEIEDVEMTDAIEDLNEEPDKEQDKEPDVGGSWGSWGWNPPSGPFDWIGWIRSMA